MEATSTDSYSFYLMYKDEAIIKAIELKYNLTWIK